MKTPEVDPNVLAAAETPIVVVDRVRLDRNIARVSAIAQAAGVALRPLVKTHKSLAIGQLQLASGAAGVTVAKSSEALVFLAGGFRDVTVAHPLVDARKIVRLMTATRGTESRLRLIADSQSGLPAIQAAASATSSVAEVLLKVGVGLRRCGVDPHSDKALELARDTHNHPALRFAGLMSHAGHAYGADGPDQVRAIAQSERHVTSNSQCDCTAEVSGCGGVTHRAGSRTSIQAPYGALLAHRQPQGPVRDLPRSTEGREHSL